MIKSFCFSSYKLARQIQCLYSVIKYIIHLFISTDPKRTKIAPVIYAIKPGLVFVIVLISAWQLGHIICVGCGPTGTTVVTICGPASVK